MQLLSIPVLCIASYTDFKTMKADPVMLLLTIFGRVAELIFNAEHAGEYLIPAVLVGILLWVICYFSLLGGADVLAAFIITLNLGFYGIPAILTACIVSVPGAVRCRRENRDGYPFIPYLTFGYVLWLFILHVSFTEKTLILI